MYKDKSQILGFILSVAFGPAGLLYADKLTGIMLALGCAAAYSFNMPTAFGVIWALCMPLSMLAIDVKNKHAQAVRVELRMEGRDF